MIRLVAIPVSQENRQAVSRYLANKRSRQMMDQAVDPSTVLFEELLIINSILDLMLPEPELGISVASLVSQQESYLELLLSTPKYSIEISSLILFSRQRN